MKFKLDHQPLLVCQPRYIFQLLSIAVVLLIFAAWNQLLQTQGVSLLTLCFSLYLIYGIGGTIYSLPPTVYIMPDGIIISRWGSHQSISWNEIEFAIERGRFTMPKSLVIGCKAFPRYRFISGLLLVSKWCPAYTLRRFGHTNYDEALKLFKLNLKYKCRRSLWF